jgi:hypothetical protein
MLGKLGPGYQRALLTAGDALCVSRSGVLHMCLFLACALCSPAGLAQSRQAQSEQQLINWYYGAVFGTGIYRSGDRTVSVLQIPFSHELQRLNTEHAGIKLTAPVSFGFYDFRFDELIDGTTPHSVSTASLFPGIEVEVPVTYNWTLKPYASAGYAWELSGPESATIYALGLKSRVGLPIGLDAELSLGNQLTLSGYKPAGSPNQPLGLFVAGLNLEIPSRLKLFGRGTHIGCHLIYYHYFKRMPFPRSDDVENSIFEEGEFALSLATSTPVPFKLFDLDRIGLAFRVGGGVQAVRLFFNLPY